MIGLFAATNLFLFYIFWELMVIPMFLLIGIWGGPQRVYAAIARFMKGGAAPVHAVDRLTTSVS